MLDWFRRQKSIDDLIMNRQYRRAIQLLQTELDREPGNERVRRKLGDVLVLAGEPERAIELLQELVDQYARAGFTAKAIALVKRMQRIDPDRATLDESLARLIATSTAEQNAPRIPAPSAAGVRPSQPDTAEPSEPTSSAPVASPEEYEARMIDFDATDAGPDMGFEEIQVGDEVPGLERYAPGGPAPETLRQEANVPPAAARGSSFEPVDLSGTGTPPIADGDDTVTPPPGSPDLPDERVAASPLFTGLQHGELAAIIRGLHLRAVHPGEIVVTEGEPGDSMFLIASGAIRVYVTDGSGRNVEVRQLAEGDFFGEISLLQGGCRTATITASEPCELLELGREDLSILAGQYPQAASVIEHFCQQRAGSREETAARSEGAASE